MTVTDDEKLVFAQASAPRMAEHTHPFLVAVVGVDDETSGRFVGTGFRMMAGSRRLVVTAHHVITAASTAPAGIACSAGSDRPPVRIPRASLLYEDVEADLAVLAIPDEYPADQSFWPSERIDGDRVARNSDFLFVHGYPAANTLFSPLLGGLAIRSLPYGVMERDEDLPDLSAWEFAVDFSPAFFQNVDGSSANLIHPPGLSGSPIWRIGAYRAPLADWTPADCTLVGVVTKWNMDKQLLVATSIERLVEFLRG